MQFSMHATKLIVADLDRAEAFYRAIGMAVVSRNDGGEGDVHQAQVWLAAGTGAGTGAGEGEAPDPHLLILSRFVELPAPAGPAYPGEVWLCFRVPDVEATIAAVLAAGGAVRRPGEDRPEHAVRAAVVTDPEGHLIELVGPMAGGG